MPIAHILILDDDLSIRSLLQRYMQREGYGVEVAATGKQGKEVVAKCQPHLVILDLNLPDISGFELCEQLKQEYPSMSILMLTSRVRPADKLQGFRLGADDYLTKPFNLAEVAARVAAILKRQRAILPSPDPGTLHLGTLVIDPTQREVRLMGRLIPLTTLEFNILLTLARHPGRVWRRSELIAQVWDPQHTPHQSDERVIDVHIGQIRKKLEANTSQPEWILTVRGIGYRLTVPEEIENWLPPR